MKPKELRRRHNALAASARNSLRLHDARDWATYANLILLCAIGASLGWAVWTLPKGAGMCLAYLDPKGGIGGYGFDPASRTFSFEPRWDDLGRCKNRPIVMLVRRCTGKEEERTEGMGLVDLLQDSKILSDENVVIKRIETRLAIDGPTIEIDCSSIEPPIEHGELAQLWLFVMPTGKQTDERVQSIRQILEAGGKTMAVAQNRAITLPGLYERLDQAQKDQFRSDIDAQ